MNFTKDEIIENRRKWAAELRSGKWKQCRSSLHRNGGYCCIGVAAVSVCGTRLEEAGPVSEPTQPYLDVRDAMGFGTHHEVRFINANDEGKTFAQIADMVDALPEPAEGGAA